MKISDSVAIVTGGASGLGKATVERLVAEGGRALIIDMNAEAGEAMVAKHGDKVLYANVDVVNEEQVKEAIQLAEKTFGAVHICINCAGIGSGGKKTLSAYKGVMELDVFRRVVNVNLIGTFNVLRLAAEVMAKNEPDAHGGRGVIINTASVAAFDGQIGQAPYSAAKAGVVGMGLTVARDLSTFGIRVNTIAPGLIDTPLFAKANDNVKQSLAETVLFPKRLGQAHEFADTVAFLIGNDYMNGEAIRMDGGIRMPPK
jgi:NAD(P)-dependent dehydrogenase (short-subunit alcohol dehydrogenase family)